VNIDTVEDIDTVMASGAVGESDTARIGSFFGSGLLNLTIRKKLNLKRQESIFGLLSFEV